MKIRYKTDIQLEKLQRQTFDFFWNEANPANGLIADRTMPDGPAGIASTGLGLSILPIAVERGFVTRQQAATRTLTTLRFFMNSRHGHEPEAAGFHGFYYKYLDLHKGRRARLSELSILDSAILFAGAITAGLYFDNTNETEGEIRYSVDELFGRADWIWAMNNGKSVMYGWKPETGFINCTWKGYDEAMLLYILGLGSPVSALPESSYKEWTSGFEWFTYYGQDYLYAPSLFVHQLPHVWIDFRGIRDEYMTGKDSDYFENSIRASLVQYRYAIENPLKYEGYGKNIWGITISEGPGPSMINIQGTDREFLGNTRRGVPFGPDDGTISPWAAITSIAFIPDVVLSAIDYLLHETDLNILNSYGFRSAFNPTFPHKPHNPHGWRSPWHIGINQGPAMAMIENFRTGFFWDLMKKSRYFVNGLVHAGFKGGWLEDRKVETQQAAYQEK